MQTMFDDVLQYSEPEHMPTKCLILHVVCAFAQSISRYTSSNMAHMSAKYYLVLPSAAILTNSLSPPVPAMSGWAMSTQGPPRPSSRDRNPYLGIVTIVASL